MLTNYNAIMHIHITFRRAIGSYVTISQTFKAFFLDVFVGDLGLKVDGLDSLGLKEESWEGKFEKDFLFFQDLE